MIRKYPNKQFVLMLILVLMILYAVYYNAVNPGSESGDADASGRVEYAVEEMAAYDAFPFLSGQKIDL